MGTKTQKVYLSNVQAPYIGSPSRAEESFANAAREVIRNKIIGKKCQFSVDYEHNSRTFVTLLVAEEYINLLVIQSGFARLVDRNGQSGPKIEEMREANEANIKQKTGVHSSD
jgi:endonuclease YncB( thermonuclease family)